MKISQKGLYALQAMMMLARRYSQGAIRIRDIAYEENLPEKFLELILLEMKNARMVDSVRGGKRFRNALEIGCAEGAFTELLADRCHSLLAVDIWI